VLQRDEPLRFQLVTLTNVNVNTFHCKELLFSLHVLTLALLQDVRNGSALAPTLVSSIGLSLHFFICAKFNFLLLVDLRACCVVVSAMAVISDNVESRDDCLCYYLQLSTYSTG